MTNPLGAVFGALKYVPASVARKALEKVNPKFKNYFSKAVSYGMDANRALDYLSDRFQSDAQRTHKEQLEQGAANNTLRPDEMLSRSQLANTELPSKIAKTALAYGGAGLLTGRNSEAPATEESNSPATVEAPLSPYPQGAGMRSGTASPQPPPRIPQGAGMIPQGNKMSQNFSFPSSNLPPHPQHASPEDFLEQYSPELAKAVRMRVQQGSLPKDVAFRLKNKPGTLKNAINLLEQDTKRDFEDVIGQIYGQEQSQKERFGDRKQRMQQAQGKDTFMQLMQKANQQLDQLMGPNG